MGGDWLDGFMDRAGLLPASWALSVLVAVGLFLLIRTVFENRTERSLGVQRLTWVAKALLVPGALVAGQALPIGGLDLDPSGPAAIQVALLVRILLWLVVAWLVVGLLDVFVWRGVVRRRTGVELPALLTNLGAAAIYLLGALWHHLNGVRATDHRPRRILGRGRGGGRLRHAEHALGSVRRHSR